MKNLINPTKPMAVKLLKDFIEETPELSLGETLFSILRYPNLKIGEPSNNYSKINWLLEVSDDDLCSSIERALINDTKEN